MPSDHSGTIQREGECDEGEVTAEREGDLEWTGLKGPCLPILQSCITVGTFFGSSPLRILEGPISVRALEQKLYWLHGESICVHELWVPRGQDSLAGFWGP